MSFQNILQLQYCKTVDNHIDDSGELESGNSVANPLRLSTFFIQRRKNHIQRLQIMLHNPNIIQNLTCQGRSKVQTVCFDVSVNIVYDVLRSFW